MDILDTALTELSQFALNMARKSTKCLDTQDELYQLCLLKIFKVWEEYEEKPEIERMKLAKRAICNQINDYWRQEGRTVELVRQYREIHRDDVFAPAHEPEDPSSQAALGARADKAVADLPPRLHAVYTMRTQGASAELIAEKLGLKVRQTYNYIRRLKELLRRGLASSQEK